MSTHPRDTSFSRCFGSCIPGPSRGQTPHLEISKVVHAAFQRLSGGPSLLCRNKGFTAGNSFGYELHRLHQARSTATKSTRLDKPPTPTTWDPGNKQTVFGVPGSCVTLGVFWEVIVLEIDHITTKRRPLCLHRSLHPPRRIKHNPHRHQRHLMLTHLPYRP